MTATKVSQLDRWPETSTAGAPARLISCSRPTTSTLPLAGVMRSINGNSAKVRPSLRQNSRARASRSAADFSGKASSRLRSTMRCLPVRGPSQPTIASPRADAVSTGRARNRLETRS